ncbi:ABC-three component system middle component 1 [Vibrio splendidus]
MNRDLIEFFSKLLRELELHAVMFSLAKDSMEGLESKNIILVRRGNVGDYFLLAEVQVSELHLVNRDMQTSLMSKLNSLLSDSSEGDLQPLSDVPVLKLNNHFEKNTNLLLFIRKTDGVEKMLSKITEVEEDEYFFKKQVVLLPSKFLDSISSEESKSSDFTINEYLQKCMNDTDKFKKFISKPNSDADYAGCAQLLEKLPFLHLDIQSSESNSLQNMIDSQIAKNSEVYSLKINSFDNDDSNLVISDKSLKDIHEATLEYVSKSEESDIKLDAKSLLTKLQGNISHE